MSMLIVQDDELRGAADRLDERERGMDEYVTLLRRAADTIKSLDLRWEEAQNDVYRLRSLLHTYEDSERLMNENVKLMAENVKLRELLLDCWDFSHLMHGAMAARFYELGLIGDDEARELGIEVTP